MRMDCFRVCVEHEEDPKWEGRAAHLVLFVFPFDRFAILNKLDWPAIVAGKVRLVSAQQLLEGFLAFPHLLESENCSFA